MKGRAVVKPMLAVVLLLVPGAAALAEEPDSLRVYQVEETLVTASPVIEGNVITRYAEVASVVSDRQIQDLHAQDLPAALRRVPGVSISRYNVIGNYGGGDGGAVFVRGHGSGRPGGEISTMVDGVPRFNGFWTHPLMDLMSLDVAEQIVVQKSPRPVTNGNMSFAALDVRSRRIEREGHQTSVNGSIGSYGTLVGRLSQGGRVGTTDYLLVASQRQSDGHRDNADGWTRSLYGKVGQRLGHGWDLSLLVNRTTSRANDPQPVGTPEPPVAESYDIESTFGLATVSRRDDATEATVRAYYDDGYADWRQWYVATDVAEQENGISDYANFGLRGRLSWFPEPATEILLGLDWDSYGGSFVSRRASIQPQETDERLANLAPYLMLSRQWGDRVLVTPSLGVRANLSSEFGSQLGWQSGVVAEAGPTRLHAGYARSFNLPGVYAAIFYGQYWSFAYEGDEWIELEPEWMDHVEVGGSHRFSDRLSMDLTWFRDEVKDAIRVVAPPPPPPRMANIGAYTTQGWEATVNLKPVEELRLFAGTSLARTTPDEVPNAPELTLTAGLAWTWRQLLRLNLDAEYVDDQYVQGTRTAAAAARVDGYQLVNCRVSRLLRIGTGLCEFFLNLENALDEEYEYRPGYPMPGRTVSLGMDVRL